MKYARLYADDAGETHFEDVEVSEAEIDFAPPAPPLFASEAIPAARALFTRFPAGWSGDWHPAPTRQYGIILISIPLAIPATSTRASGSDLCIFQLPAISGVLMFLHLIRCPVDA